MKKSIFTYFDKYYFGELVENNDDPNWFKGHSFGYHDIKQIVFYNDSILRNSELMFSINRMEFQKFFSEWFKIRYNLPIEGIM